MSDVKTLPVVSGHNLLRLDTNFKRLRDVINEEVLHLIGGNNTMQQDLDMNSHLVLNAKVDLGDGTSLVTVDGVKQLIAEMLGGEIGDVINQYFVDGADETVINSITEQVVNNLAETILNDPTLLNEFTTLIIEVLEQAAEGGGAFSESLVRLITAVLIDGIDTHPDVKEQLQTFVVTLLEETDIKFASVTTDTYFRGKTVKLIPDEFGNVTMDWETGTVFELDTLDTAAGEIYITLTNMPDVEEDEEQTVYMDLINGGNKPIIVDAAFQLEFPNITQLLAEGYPPLTEDGRDYILCASNNGTTVTVIFIYDMGPDPSHPTAPGA